MRLPNDPNKFTSQFKYVEIARYLTNYSKVAREKKDGKSLLLPWEKVSEYAEKYDNTGIYTSVFQYNSNDIDQAASLGPLYFDLDSNDLEISYSETVRLVEFLLSNIGESGIRVYFSGGKGFHVECEPIALGVSTSDDLAKVFRFIARDITDKLKLTSTDFNVYDVRRMWRLPNSRHQRSGLFKVECMQLLKEGAKLDDIIKWADRPREVNVPEQAFDFKANKWYREYAYALEASLAEKPNTQDILSRFLEQGSGNVRSFEDTDKVFDKFKLFKNCPVIKELQNKAIKNHHLEHYERLFLCSLLTYTPDAIRFLHEILSECSDYNWEISNSHLDDWIKRRKYGIGGRPFTCEKAQQVGIGCSGCEKVEPRKKVVQLSTNKYIETQEYSSPSPVRFCYSTKKT
jgi:hypothetical protein